MKNSTEIIFILDKSGSMDILKNDAIGGFNSLLEEQKKVDGEAYLTLVLFNQEYQLVHNGKNIQEVMPMTEKDYIPSGTTAYFDAIGKTIDDVGIRLSNMPEEERPKNIMIVIMTDGHENASVEYNNRNIKSKIKQQQEVYNWKFIFLAANQDAFDSANQIGISNYSNFGFSGQSVGNTYSTLSRSVSNYRGTGALAQMPENID